jgi:hypothetical protein
MLGPSVACWADSSLMDLGCRFPGNGSGPADGPVAGVPRAPDAPSLVAGTAWRWSGGVRQGADPFPGGHDVSGPRPGRGDLRALLAAAAGRAGGGVQDPVAQGLAGRLTVFTSESARRDLRYLRTGDIFGEVAILVGGGRTASVEATTDVTLLEFPKETFDGLLGHPKFRARIDERQAMYAHAARPPVDSPQAGAGPTAAPGDLELCEQDRELREREMTRGVKLAEGPVEAPPWTPPRRFPWVRQIDEADCGAASVAMVCRAFGQRVSMTFIRAAVGTSEQGCRWRARSWPARRVGQPRGPDGPRRALFPPEHGPGGGVTGVPGWRPIPADPEGLPVAATGRKFGCRSR